MFLTDMPNNLREAGNVAAVPEIIGTNREEGSLGVPACESSIIIYVYVIMLHVLRYYN